MTTYKVTISRLEAWLVVIAALVAGMDAAAWSALAQAAAR